MFNVMENIFRKTSIFVLFLGKFPILIKYSESTSYETPTKSYKRNSTSAVSIGFVCLYVYKHV